MKIFNKPIEMIAWFDEKGVPNPIRFRIKNENDSFTIIKINSILIRDKEKLAGNSMLIFRCKSCINEIEKIYEVKYEMNTCKWVLWKM